MKTIEVDEEAYRFLEERLLGPEDSFSAVVKRQLDALDGLDESFGAWSHLGAEELEEQRREARRYLKARDYGSAAGR